MRRLVSFSRNGIVKLDGWLLTPIEAGRLHALVDILGTYDERDGLTPTTLRIARELKAELDRIDDGEGDK